MLKLNLYLYTYHSICNQWYHTRRHSGFKQKEESKDSEWRLSCRNELSFGNILCLGCSNVYIHNYNQEQPSRILEYVKNTLFSAETWRKRHFSAGYRNFFAIFTADFNKTSVIMIIGRKRNNTNCWSFLLMYSPSTGMTLQTFKTRLKHTRNCQKTNARCTLSWSQRMELHTTATITWSKTKWPWTTCLGHESYIRTPHEITTNEILHDMSTQFLKISSRFTHADKAKGVKTLTFFATIYWADLALFYRFKAKCLIINIIDFLRRKVILHFCFST